MFDHPGLLHQRYGLSRIEFQSRIVSGPGNNQILRSSQYPARCLLVVRFTDSEGQFLGDRHDYEPNWREIMRNAVCVASNLWL